MTGDLQYEGEPTVYQGKPQSTMMLTSRPIASAFRLVSFRRVMPEDVPESAPVLLLLVAAFALVPALLALAFGGAVGRFDIQHLSHALFPVAVLLAGAAALAGLLRASGLLPRLLAAGLLAGIAIQLLVGAVGLVATWGTWAYEQMWLGMAMQYLPSLWLGLAIARFAVDLGALPGLRRLAVLLAAFALVTVPIHWVDYNPSMWLPDLPPVEGDPAAGGWDAAREEALYAQPRLLERELAAVERGTPGTIDVFFVGVGGYGYQDVFRKEVDAVAALFRERFGAGGRIVKLINNPKTALTHPMASVTALRASLVRVADRMDPEDVAFIFLTSHGTERHRFSLDLQPFRLQELTPAVLRKALDDAGIRNRVMVVSACYSGGFVEPLRDPHTLVITASAANRNSFGCSNTAEWTYFGKAYFDEALRSTHSFTAALEAAKPVIAAREKAEGFEPSNPQVALGETLIPTLQALERQFSR